MRTKRQVIARKKQKEEEEKDKYKVKSDDENDEATTEEKRPDTLEQRAARMIQVSWRVREKLRRVRITRSMVNKRIRDIIIYMTFLLVYWAAAIVPFQNEDRFYFVEGLKGQFYEVEFGPDFSPTWGKAMKDVATVEEMYHWMQSTFLGTVYGGGTFDGPGGVDTSGLILGYGKVVGGVRIGTHRVKPTNDCLKYAYTPFIGKEVKQICVPTWDSDNSHIISKEDYGDFGNVSTAKFQWKGWNGTDTAKEQGMLYSSQSTPSGVPDRSYPTPAYSVVLPNRDGEKAKKMIQMLIDAKYVDLQTKDIVFDVTVYNLMLNLLVQCRMMFVITHSGGVIPAFQTNAASLTPIPFMEGTIFFNNIGKVLVFFFYLYFIYVEFSIIRRVGIRNYLNYPEEGRLIHNANIILYFVVWMTRFIAYSYLPAEIDTDGDGYITLRSYTEILLVGDMLMSFNACLCFIKLIFYLSLSHHFAIVTLTLTQSAKAVFGFLIVEAITMAGFASMFMITFGSKVFNYKTFSESVYTLLLALLGDADLSELREANWYAGPIFFFLYVCIQVFVVLNMVIAIISDAYSEAEELLKKKKDYNLSQELYTYITNRIFFKLPFCGNRLRFYFSNSKVAQRARKLQKKQKSQKKLYQKPLAHSPSSRTLLNQMRIRRASVMEQSATELVQKKSTIVSAGLNTIPDNGVSESIENLQTQVEENKETLETIQKQLAQMTLQLSILIKQQHQINPAVVNPRQPFQMSPGTEEPELLD